MRKHIIMCPDLTHTTNSIYLGKYIFPFQHNVGDVFIVMNCLFIKWLIIYIFKSNDRCYYFINIAHARQASVLLYKAKAQKKKISQGECVIIIELKRKNIFLLHNNLNNIIWLRVKLKMCWRNLQYFGRILICNVNRINRHLVYLIYIKLMAHAVCYCIY